MIYPYLRHSFGRAEAALVIGLLASDTAAREREEARLREEGFDALLDDPRTLNALLAGSNTGPGVAPASSTNLTISHAPLIFYILVRHALLEDGINNPIIADYLAALLLEFGRERRAYRISASDEEEYDYLVDIMDALVTAQGRNAFMLKAHLGNFSLWLSGLFPDRITARVHRKGAPGLSYYEEMGATGYRLAAETSTAESCGLDGLFQTFAHNFSTLRIALNRIADRYLFPSTGDPVDRLLRQIKDKVGGRGLGGSGAASW